MSDLTVLRNGLLIDCTGREPQEHMAVVVEGKRIADVSLTGASRCRQEQPSSTAAATH
jgi:hypothetical protein